MEDDTILLLFTSIHQVMKAEQLFMKRGLDIDLVPVPREISSDCGLGVALPAARLEAARECLRTTPVSLRPRFFRRLGNGGYQPLPETAAD